MRYVKALVVAFVMVVISGLLLEQMTSGTSISNVVIVAAFVVIYFAVKSMLGSSGRTK